MGMGEGDMKMVNAHYLTMLQNAWIQGGRCFRIIRLKKRFPPKLRHGNAFYIIFSKTLKPSLWRGYIDTLVVFSVLRFPNMLRKASEAISEGNGPFHQDEEFGFGQPTPVDDF